jgi:hypothetical protein
VAPYLAFDGRLIEDARGAVHVGREIVATEEGVENLEFPAFELGGRFAVRDAEPVLALHRLDGQSNAGPHPGIVSADGGVPEEHAFAIEGETEVFEGFVGDEATAGELKMVATGLFGLKL